MRTQSAIIRSFDAFLKLTFSYLVASLSDFLLISPAPSQVCALKLLSSAHLARSFHHLFPVPGYEEISALADVDSHTEEHSKEHEEHSKEHTAAHVQPSADISDCRGCGVKVNGATGACVSIYVYVFLKIYAG